VLQRAAVSSLHKVVTVIPRVHDKPSFRKSEIIEGFLMPIWKPNLFLKADDSMCFAGNSRAVLTLEHT
jgi:hypothetical protein